ncbi:hypothetical protein J1N35_014724 [Gossypium stocksii]|uniref:Uncharacterized protein n=1 Tax=Gossypium stocksii TaxID=47602 RepID=A0A9D4A7Y6_9ROSI|nr:hypothetical protein J1N35_014724 [Gossypium stocksii]
MVKYMETTVVVKLLGCNIGYGLDLLSEPTVISVQKKSLLEVLYKRRIREEIGGLVGKVAKFDSKTDSGSRGQFARMAIVVNLDRPLISQILVNAKLQRIEYELYGHAQVIKSALALKAVDRTLTGPLQHAKTGNDPI